MGFNCIGYEHRELGLTPNCANCKNWDKTCLVRYILDDLYAESRAFNAFDRMMRSNRGVSI